jgi:hypothetical protein
MSFIERGFVAISLHQMPSDLISNIRKKLQDRFTLQASHPIEIRRIKSKKVLALINEIQIQDSCTSDEESDTVTPTKTASNK